MKTVEVNKGNWTGENGKVQLYADGTTFKIYGTEKFKIVSDGDDAWKLMGVTSDGELYDTDCRGYTFDGPSWYFQNWAGDIHRESTKDVRLAAAKLMFMLF